MPLNAITLDQAITDWYLIWSHLLNDITMTLSHHRISLYLKDRQIRNALARSWTWTIQSTSGMSRPLAATSVQSRMPESALQNWKKVVVRFVCFCLPWKEKERNWISNKCYLGQVPAPTFSKVDLIRERIFRPQDFNRWAKHILTI